MRPLRHRITACIAGLAYLLASAVSGLLHHHPHGAAHPGGQEHCLASGHEHTHGPANEHGQRAGLGGNHGTAPCPQPLSDDDCAACRFVSQAAVFYIPAADITPLPMMAETRVVAPSFFIEPVRRNRLARAPPLG